MNYYKTYNRLALNLFYWKKDFIKVLRQIEELLKTVNYKVSRLTMQKAHYTNFIIDLQYIGNDKEKGDLLIEWNYNYNVFSIFEKNVNKLYSSHIGVFSEMKSLFKFFDIKYNKSVLERFIFELT